jgi:hypothetical protein
MYEGDAPLAERRAQALTLDRDLLRELLGQEELRELLDADADLELSLRPSSTRARPRPDQVHDLLRRIGDLAADGSGTGRRAPGPRSTWPSSLPRGARCGPGSAGRRWIAMEDVCATGTASASRRRRACRRHSRARGQGSTACWPRPNARAVPRHRPRAPLGPARRRGRDALRRQVRRGPPGGEFRRAARARVRDPESCDCCADGRSRSYDARSSRRSRDLARCCGVAGRGGVAVGGRVVVALQRLVRPRGGRPRAPGRGGRPARRPADPGLGPRARRPADPRARLPATAARRARRDGRGGVGRPGPPRPRRRPDRTVPAGPRRPASGVRGGRCSGGGRRAAVGPAAPQAARRLVLPRAVHGFGRTVGPRGPRRCGTWSGRAR